jgi:putative heme iron utilization protein
MVSTEKEIDTNLADLMNDIISQDNILFSVRSSGAVCEARVEQGIPLRISESYLTIGNESSPWHMHVNLNETKEARFVKENKIDGRTSYSIRFFDLKGILILRANFVKMYDSSNKIIQERLLKYEEIFAKYGKKERLILS